MDINTNQNLNVNLSEDNLTRAKDLKLKESARKLEGVFLQFMLKPMEEGMTKSMFGEESNTNLAKSMFSQVMADAMSKNNNMPEDKKLNFEIWYNKKNNLIMKVSYSRMGNWEYVLKKFE